MYLFIKNQDWSNVPVYLVFLSALCLIPQRDSKKQKSREDFHTKVYAIDY